MPPGEQPLTAADRYRFDLSHPAVDVCMMGARNRTQMQANLKVLASGLPEDVERERIERGSISKLSF